MVFDVIHNPGFEAKTGFTTYQFRKLDDLYCRAAAHKVLVYRTVECDFERSEASYTYYKNQSDTPYLQFVIKKVGPQTMMYELYKENSGRIAKSGLFERTFERLFEEVEVLLET